MKKILIFACLAVYFMISAPHASAQEDIYANTRAAVKAGSSKALGKYLGNEIELNLLNSKSRVERTQAEQKLKTFFSNHPPQAFQYDHKGSSDEGLIYVIGTYKSNNESFRVYILFRPKGNDYVIDTLDFRKS